MGLWRGTPSCSWSACAQWSSHTSARPPRRHPVVDGLPKGCSVESICRSGRIQFVLTDLLLSLDRTQCGRILCQCESTRTFDLINRSGRSQLAAATHAEFKPHSQECQTQPCVPILRAMRGRGDVSELQKSSGLLVIVSIVGNNITMLTTELVRALGNRILVYHINHARQRLRSTSWRPRWVAHPHRVFNLRTTDVFSDSFIIVVVAPPARARRCRAAEERLAGCHRAAALRCAAGVVGCSLCFTVAVVDGTRCRVSMARIAIMLGPTGSVQCGRRFA